MSLMYKVCERMICRGNIDNNFAAKILAFKNTNIFSEEEYNNLTALMAEVK